MIVIGLATLLFVPDTPMQALWLTDPDKVALLKHISVNRTGIQSRKFQPRQILDALTDFQLYLMVLAVILVGNPVTFSEASIMLNVLSSPYLAAW